MLGPEAWNEHWDEDNIPWDLGGVTPALVQWSQGFELKGLHVLTPGCGNGHDAHFLSKRGASVTAVDFAQSALDSAAARYPQSRVTWQLADVTTMPYENQFDRVWEYTCFCALPPEARHAYLDRVHAALKPGGVYWGMVFSSVPNPESGPPFQIDPGAFKQLLSDRFSVDAYEPVTRRSVRARGGSEIWFSVKKENI